MPALVNYSGDDNFYSGGPFCSGDSGILLSIGSHVDIYCPARKRARISGPLVVEGSVFEDKRPSIDRLPDECLFEIFRHLPGGRERSASACVSKRWLTILSGVRSSEFYRSKVPQGQSDGMNVDLASNNTESISQDEDLAVECDGYLTRCVEGKKATDVRLAAIAVCTSRRGGLGKLSIRGSNSDRGVTDLGLSAIARGCPSLRFLSLWNVPSIGDEGLFEIARECHSLEKLDLCQCPSISNKSIVAIAKSCPNLTALTVESCLNIGNESLQAVGKCCPKLQSITIKDCPLVRDQGVASLLSSASSLMKVKLQTLNISDCSLAVIGHYGKSITSLVLSGLQNVSQKGFWVMGNARGLQTLASLAITSCRGVTDLSLEAIGKGCPNLKQMCIRKCFFVSDNGLVAFAKAVGSLESLQLEECNRITQTGILNAISNCNSKLKSLTLVKCMGIKDLSPESLMLSPSESLRSLAIRSCLGFGSTSLAMLGKLCPQLHHLDLSGLCGITDTGLLPLLESCEAGLTKVNLSHCVNLTDEVVFALARLHGGALELLNLDGCHKVTDASLEVLANNCPLLYDLDLSKCSITDSGVDALSCGVQPNLQILSLSGCSMISNKSITALKKLGRTLVGLNLQHCNSIGSHTIELLTENLWRCDILS
ncbi:EIN3-binding F-box protein 1-like isoform X1 [Olea europaea var. sylvestris]|uniref:EIN3-binding F-box protein 1-like isoform X1 n=1 Tax=Olea europaea var. sylvestris TaxID=158386 RepID=UPI000C1D1289|nr:EIN3-binding F-box protein 1-like isoform X1 [Olea europaea var. sylvestris]